MPNEQYLLFVGFQSKFLIFVYFCQHRSVSILGTIIHTNDDNGVISFYLLYVFLSALSKQPPSQLCYLLPLLPPPYSSAFPQNSASSKVCSNPPPPPLSPAPPLRHQALAPVAPAPPTSSPPFIMTDIDHNLTTSVANASHGCSSVWSVDLLFFEASWLQAAPRLFPFYCPAYHFFLLGDSPKNQFFFSGWLKAVKPILWSSFCHAALHLLQSK